MALSKTKKQLWNRFGRNLPNLFHANLLIIIFAIVIVIAVVIVVVETSKMRLRERLGALLEALEGVLWASWGLLRAAQGA